MLSDCHFNRNITGNYIIKLNNCVININGITYENTIQIFKEEQIIQLMHGIEIEENKIKTTSLLDLSNKQLENTIIINELHIKEKTHNTIQ